MHSWHAKSRCCRAKIYHFGSRRRQCSQCKRTWRIRKKRRGRKPQRARPGALKAVFVDGRTLKTLAPRYGLTPQGLSWRFRGDLRQFISRSRALRLPRGPLVLVLDGLYFRFRRKDWVLYVMAVKPCHQNRAVFLDPVLRQAERTCRAGLTHSQPFPPRYTDVSGPRSPTRFPVLSSSVQARAGSFSSAIFISSVDCRTAEADAIADCMEDPCARRFTNMTRQALELPDGRRLRSVLTQLRHRVRASKTTACHAHDRSRVSQTDRPFQSLSQISKIKSANYYRQPRSYEPKSS